MATYIKKANFQDLVQGALAAKSSGGGKYIPKKLQKEIRKDIYYKTPRYATTGMNMRVALKEFKDTVAAGQKMGITFKYKATKSLGAKKMVREEIKKIKAASASGENQHIKTLIKMRQAEERVAELDKPKLTKAVASISGKDAQREALSRESTHYGKGDAATASALGDQKPTASVSNTNTSTASAAEPEATSSAMDLPID